MDSLSSQGVKTKSNVQRKKKQAVRFTALAIVTGAIRLITFYLCILWNFDLSLQVKSYNLHEEKHPQLGHISMQHVEFKVKGPLCAFFSNVVNV